MTNHSRTIEEQIAYYRARAPEYDQWFFRQGRYDRGLEPNRRWFAEIEELRNVVRRAEPSGRVLEIACGTGLWTGLLLERADHVVALDASEEMIDLNRVRNPSGCLRFQTADVFDWSPAGRFDFIFFAFWLSHVPPERFDDFWSLIRSSLRPGGRVFFIDSLHNPASTAVDHELPDETQSTLTRRLNDGRQYEIVKLFYDPADLERRLLAQGWDIETGRTNRYFLFGRGGPVSGAAESLKDQTGHEVPGVFPNFGGKDVPF